MGSLERTVLRAGQASGGAMRLAPQRQQKGSNRYMVRAYGSYDQQRDMRAAAKRLEEALRQWK